MCKCQLAAFYQYGGFSMVFICIAAFFAGNDCEYVKHCMPLFGSMMATGAFAAIQAIMMLNLSWAYGAIDLLTVDDLQMPKMTLANKRYGGVLRRFPAWSQTFFGLVGVGALACVATGGGACPAIPDEATCKTTGTKPDPAQHGGIVFGIFAVMALSGCRTKATITQTPWLHDADPGDDKVGPSPGKAGFIRKIGQKCHP
eukprot:TRINITY_DN55308_c0_g1_i1.p3 TRINITY_DN55308_c0_g1~~TRINITY_DN55308_c0_g1_i1.p3  ORF type:complete len:200 (+),score=36.70 TRINITY_DN55308_c0_g1_i1:155-754(+)